MNEDGFRIGHEPIDLDLGGLVGEEVDGVVGAYASAEDLAAEAGHLVERIARALRRAETNGAFRWTDRSTHSARIAADVARDYFTGRTVVTDDFLKAQTPPHLAPVGEMRLVLHKMGIYGGPDLWYLEPEDHDATNAGEIPT